MDAHGHWAVIAGAGVRRISRRATSSWNMNTMSLKVSPIGSNCLRMSVVMLYGMLATTLARCASPG